jgi:hypothetical protein
MKIRSHSESHVVEFDDGSQWQIFPGDLDVTLNRKPEADLRLERTRTTSVRMRLSARLTAAR